MILTTPTKQHCTTTKHNNKNYIFTLYLCMFLCVVGNCLLFYCSCLGNCENCCGINGNASVSGGINDKSESENYEYANESNEEIKIENDNMIYDDQYENECKNENENKNENIKNKSEIVTDNKSENENKNEIGNKSKIENKGENKAIYNNMHFDNNFEHSQKTLIEKMEISNDGKINNIKIVNEAFAQSVNVYQYQGFTDAEYEGAKNKFIQGINIESGTHLSAYVEVKDVNKVKLRYFIYHANASNISINNGLFQDSQATKIVILRCGNNVTDMSYMFYNCSKLTELDLSSLKTNNVTNMSCMFSDCINLLKLDLSNFNTNNVTNMRCMFLKCSSLKELNLDNWDTNNVTNMEGMFLNCSSLTELDLSNFNTENVINMKAMFYNCSSLTNIKFTDKFNTSNVIDMYCMFYNCFKEKQPSTLICKASTIQKITDNRDYSGLIIQNENKDEINDKLKGNTEQVYKCSVERAILKDYPKVAEPKIIGIEEFIKEEENVNEDHAGINICSII